MPLPWLSGSWAAWCCVSWEQVSFRTRGQLGRSSQVSAQVLFQRLCPSCLSLALFPSLTGPLEAGVTQTPRYLITRTGRQLTLHCSQDLNHDAMYWYRQDPGLGPKLISLSRNVDFTEDGDVPEGYTVSRKEKKKFPLTVKSAGTNQTSLYLCASSVSTARLGQLLSAQKGHHKSEESPSWGAPPQAGGKLPPPSVPLEALS